MNNQLFGHEVVARYREALADADRVCARKNALQAELGTVQESVDQAFRTVEGYGLVLRSLGIDPRDLREAAT